MLIDLNNDFNLTDVQRLISSGDNVNHYRLSVTKSGIAKLVVVDPDYRTEDYLFYLETFNRSSNYVGPEALKDSDWVNRIYSVLKLNYPNPSSNYIELF